MSLPTFNPRIIVEMTEKGELTFDNPFQRTYVWRIPRRSLLIMSLIDGSPIPPFYANRINGTYDILEGLQRCNAINDYLNDKYALVNVPKIKYKGEVVDFNGKVFSELPDEIQRIIENRHLTLEFGDNMSEERIRTLVFRTNNGISFTSAQKRRVQARSFDTFVRLKQHPLFQTTNSSGKKKTRKEEDIQQKSWVISFYENPSFQTSFLNPIIENDEVTKEQELQLNEAYTRLYNAYTWMKTQGDKNIQKAGTKIKRKTNLITLVPLSIRANKENISEDDFILWLISFFKCEGSGSINEEYNIATRQGSGSASAIKTRLDILNKSYEEFLNNK